jgi:hypothetical protein
VAPIDAEAPTPVTSVVVIELAVLVTPALFVLDCVTAVCAKAAGAAAKRAIAAAPARSPFRLICIFSLLTAAKLRMNKSD